METALRDETRLRIADRAAIRRPEAVPEVTPEQNAPAELGVSERSAAEPARRPTALTARDARLRNERDAAMRFRVDHARRKAYAQLQRRTAEPRPFGPENHANVRQALAEERSVRADHPYARHQAQLNTRLDALGMPRTGTDRIHVDEGPDRELDHGRSVVRTAIGRTGLARGANTTLHSGPVDESLARRELSPEQAQRYLDARRLEEGPPSPNTTLDQLIQDGAREQEVDLLEKRLRLAEMRGELERRVETGRTFVNLSWGSSPAEAAGGITQQMMEAPPGSALHRSMVEAMGGPPPRMPTERSSRAEVERFERYADRLARDVVRPRLEAAMATPEHRQRMAAARSGLEQELANGRRANMLVFEAPTNSYLDAERMGNPALSRSASDGVRGLISVGAIDINGPGHRDDRVAPFSGDGTITIGAPGARIPVGAERGQQDIDGTSFASPYATSIAYRMAAANPNLSVDQIAALIQDPRAVRDIAGTTRDGAGHVDPFRAVLLARNPNLTAAQLDQAWDVAGRGNAEQRRRLIAELGLR